MTELIPGLLSLVDDKKFAFNSAVEISYLTADEQEMVRSFMESDSWKNTPVAARWTAL